MMTFVLIGVYLCHARFTMHIWSCLWFIHHNESFKVYKDVSLTTCTAHALICIHINIHTLHSQNWIDACTAGCMGKFHQ